MLGLGTGGFRLVQSLPSLLPSSRIPDSGNPLANRGAGEVWVVAVVTVLNVRYLGYYRGIGTGTVCNAWTIGVPK